MGFPVSISYSSTGGYKISLGKKKEVREGSVKQGG